jgi:hypothetical protein
LHDNSIIDILRVVSPEDNPIVGSKHVVNEIKSVLYYRRVVLMVLNSIYPSKGKQHDAKTKDLYITW